MSTNIADSLRKSMHAIVSQRGKVEGSSAISEATLIRDGAFCGRKFSMSGFNLVWFQEEGQVKFYSPLGTLEMSCSVAQFCALVNQSDTGDMRRAA